MFTETSKFSDSGALGGNTKKGKAYANACLRSNEIFKVHDEKI